jgi:phosphoglucosamine mutase
LPQVLVNVPLARRLPDAAQRLADAIEPIERQLGDHGRVLVRSSGTEPLLRIMVEAETSEQAEAAAASLAATATERFA